MSTKSDYAKAKFAFDVFNFLPQGHEKALKQAFYNTAAILLVLIVFVGAVAVYFVLEPFLRPLLWAVLFGSVLHPFKASLAYVFKNWLQGLQTTNTPLVVGSIVMPFRFVDGMSETVGDFLLKYIKAIVVVSVGIPILLLVYNFLPHTLLYGMYSGLIVILRWISNILEFFSTAYYLVWTIIIGYVVTLWFWWTPQSKDILCKISIIIWTILVFHIATITGSLRVPILLISIILLMMGFITEVKSKQDENITQDEKSTEIQRATTPLVTLQAGWAWIVGAPNSPSAVKIESSIKKSGPNLYSRLKLWYSSFSASFWKIISSARRQEKDDDYDNIARKISTKRVRFSEQLEEAIEPVLNLKMELLAEKKTSTDEADEATSSLAQKVQVEPGTPEKCTVVKPSTLSLPGAGSSIKEETQKEQQLSNVYLYCLLWACVIAQLWPHMWLLHLFPIPVVYIIAKRLGSHFGLWSFIGLKFNAIWKVCCHWCEVRRDALVPSPVRGLWRLMAQGDKMITSILEGSIDTFTSIAVILIVFILAVVGTIFLAVQIYGESMHLVGVTSSLINQTLVHNSDIQELLPESLLDVQGTLDSMLGDAYVYGREWISTSLKRLIDEKDEVRAAALEKQILEVWDRVYHLWVSRNVSGPVFDTHHQSASFDNLIDGLKTLNIGLLVNFVKENIGTFMKVLESVWMVLKGNISLALSILTATISLVFGGGTAVLNFILNFVVFSTALFYLLCASGSKYKPQEIFTQMLPSTYSGIKLGVAINEAINGVFAASFKMAAFYGMYTWLIHTVFDVKIIYIPSVLAALFGAVPFLGAYWACLPAVLELWLVQGRVGIAGLMLTFQLLPTSFVDSAIYSEIKGGGHPYITGLAIAGGVFCLGFEGALFGPLLLCFFFVAINMYSSMMQDTPVEETVHPSSRHALKRTNSQ
ncbi:transmembrane protein 245 isoform X1 [Centruroides vittatus]|uniref:transmembrane protein 245 isoform X1 n=1 Tax=Centruroides vittatus TaxID=120091 RepID=UPI00350EE112